MSVARSLLLVVGCMLFCCMLFVACCLMIAGCCLSFAERCSLLVVCGLLSVVACGLLLGDVVVGCWLLVVLLFVDGVAVACCLLIVACCLLFVGVSSLSRFMLLLCAVCSE